MTNTMSNVPGLLDDQPVVFDRVEIEQHYDTITSDLPEPDPTWQFIDAQGHGHFMADNPANRYPTLVWTITRTYYCADCQDEHDEGEYRCRLCGEAIQPATRAPRGPIRILTHESFSATITNPGVPLVQGQEYVVKIGRDVYATYLGEITMTSAGTTTVTLNGALRTAPL